MTLLVLLKFSARVLTANACMMMHAVWLCAVHDNSATSCAASCAASQKLPTSAHACTFAERQLKQISRLQEAAACSLMAPTAPAML